LRYSNLIISSIYNVNIIKLYSNLIISSIYNGNSKNILLLLPLNIYFRTQK